MDWRQVFVERYKLRRAWMGGQCHVRTFEGHSGGISCVQFDGGRIVSGSHDKTIKVWNVKTNSPWSVITLAGHSGEVRCLHLGTFNTEKTFMFHAIYFYIYLDILKLSLFILECRRNDIQNCFLPELNRAPT